MKTNTNKIYFLIIGVVATLLIGSVGFLVFHKNSPPSSVLSAENNMNQNSQNQRFGSGRGFRNIPSGSKPIFGQIIAVVDSKITVQGRSSDLNVVLNESTKYTGGTKSDLKVNDRVFGYGTSNTDGTITAEQLTINPPFPNRGQNFNGGSPANTPSI